jgi:uncharacterized protein YndB with AHSA1/START domain
MSTQNIDVRETSTAPVHAVWDLLADVDSWPAWSGVEKAERLAPGDPAPDGLGSRRLFLTGRVRNEEEVVRFEPPHHLSYEVRGGNLPIRDYHADVTLSEAPDGGTVIEWRSAFRAKYPGTGGFVRRKLEQFIAETAQGLAAHAARGRQAG